MTKFIGFIAGLLLPVVALAGVDLSNQLKLGDKTATDKKIVFDKGAGSSNPCIRWNNATSKLQFSNDCTTFTDFGAATFTNPTFQKLTASSGTYTTPASVRYLKIRMVGGGGGGAGSGTAGGANQTAGGQSTFGVLATANGGGVGTWGGGLPAAGGTASISAPAFGTTITGGQGGGSNYQNTQAYGLGGSGGSSPFGGAGAAGGYTGGGGGSAQAFTGSGGGGGGTGTTGNSYTGSGGSAGGYAEFWVPSPSASYSYTVGAAGTAGGAGANGTAGGSGGSGVILVEEFY